MVGLIGRKVEFIITLGSSNAIQGVVLDKVLSCNIVGIPIDYYIIQECSPEGKLYLIEPTNIKKVIKNY